MENLKIELINFQIMKNNIKYSFFKNGREEHLIIEMIDKKLDYTDYSIASNIVKDNFVNIKNKTIPKTKLEKVEIEKLISIVHNIKIEEEINIPKKIKISNDEELNLILKDVYKIKKELDLNSLKMIIENLANKLYQIKNKLKDKDIKKLREMYFYYFDKNILDHKNITFLKNSESNNLIKIILNIY